MQRRTVSGARLIGATDALGAAELLRTWLLFRELRAGVHRPWPQTEALQDRLLRDTVRHAARQVPFYRNFWREAGFDAATFRGLADLERIPVTTRSRVLAAVESNALVADGIDTATCSSIVTHGSRRRTWLRPLEERVRRANGLRIWFDHGHRWHHVTTQFRRQPPPPHLLQRLGVARQVWIPSENPIERQCADFVAARADVVFAMPSKLRELAHALDASGARPKRPHTVLTAGELLDDETTALVERTLGTRPTAVYGQTETGIAAWQCERRDGFHIGADTHVVEVTRDGGAAAPGALGTVLLTTLRARTMPFIRYDTEDLARAPDGRPCPCGRTLPLLPEVEGRLSGAGRAADGTVVTTRRIVNALAGLRPLESYRVHLLRDGGIRLQLTDIGAGDNGEPAMLARLRTLFGDVPIALERVPPWPPDSSGKTKAVVAETSLVLTEGDR